MDRLCSSLSFPIYWEDFALTEALQDRLNSAKMSKLSDKISTYEGFGSFHSPNIEHLMLSLEDECEAPAFFPSFARRILSNEALTAIGMLSDPSLSCQSWLGAHSVRSQAPDILKTVPHTEERSKISSSTNKDCSDDFRGKQGDPGRTAHDDQFPLQCSESYLCAMGQAFREKFFCITRDTVFINHGAFGSALSGAIAIKQWYEKEMENEVVDFVDRKLFQLLVYSTFRIAHFVRADPKQLVIVQNATFGLNCAMQLIIEGDVVGYFDTEYLAVYNMLLHRCQEVGATYHEVPLSKYLHNKEIMGDDEALTQLICDQLPAGCTVVVVDYITSTTALCFPIFTHIIPALRRYGVSKIIVDGAHAPLQVDLDFRSLREECQPSVFAANLHKWFSAPKSVGFLWVRREDITKIRSVVRSHGATSGFHSQFMWSGTSDHGASLCIPALVDFWESQGCNRIREYCTSLLTAVVDMLSGSFGTHRVARRSPFMSLVELPKGLQSEFLTATYIQDLLHDMYKIEVPIKRVEGRFYVRVSVFVYNTPEEYLYLRESILSLTAQWTDFTKSRVCVGQGAEGGVRAV